MVYAKKTESGFAALELLLIIVIVGVIAFVAWRVVDVNGTVQQAANSAPQSTVVPSTKKTTDTTAAVVPASNSDLTTLQKQLDNNSPTDNTTGQLDAQASF